MESFIHRKMQKLETKISLIVKTTEIIFLQYKLEKVAVDSLLPTQFERVTVPKREVCSWVSLHKFIFSDVIFHEHLRCSRFSVENTEKLQLTLTLNSAPHPMQQSTTFCHSTHPHSCQSISRSVQFSSVGQSCLTLCNPMDHSMQGLPVHHQLLEFTQTHVH